MTSQQRSDSMARALDLLGTGRHPGSAGMAMPVLDRAAIDATLLHSWTGRREITQPMRDLVREGIEVNGLPDWVNAAALKSALEGDPRKRRTEGHAGLMSALSEWWAVGVAYGGSLLIPVVEDGREPWEPLDLSAIQTIRSWEVLDRYEVCPWRRTHGGPVEYWLLATPREAIASSRQIVHPSRCLPHWGEWMPPRWRAAFGGWGASRLELLADLRAGMDIATQSFGRYLDRFHQDVVILGELQELLEAEGGTEALITKLATLVRATRTLGVQILDAGRAADLQGNEPERRGDTFQSVSRPASGAPEVASWVEQSWRKGTGMPEVVADGTAGGGLNSGEEAGQWRAWAGTMKGEQQQVTPAVVWCMDVVFAAKDGPTKGKQIEEYTVTWKRLDSDDPKLEAEVNKLEAETDLIARDTGSLTPRDIRQWRNVEQQHGVPKVESADMLPLPGEVDVSAEVQANAAGELLGAAGDVQQQALNGAQMASLRELVSAVALGQIPASVAEWLVSVAVPGIDIARARTALQAAAAFSPEPMPSPTSTAASIAARVADAFGVDNRIRLDASLSSVGERPSARWIAAIAKADAYPLGGVFVRVPDSLARQFPYKPDDTSPPHVTVLFCGPITWEEHATLRAVVAEATASWQPVRATFGAVNYFEKPDGSRVAWVAVDFEPAVAALHEVLRTSLPARGVQVRHHPGPWVAHATLGYLAPGEDYSGPVPTGSWMVQHVEVWHGEERGG